MTGYVKQQYASPGSSVTGLLSNGSRIECDLLIGADGIHSKARPPLLRGSRATLLGRCATTRPLC